MAQTILNCIEDVCYRVGVQPPSSLYNSTDPVARQWLHMFYKTCEYIRDVVDYPTLKRTYGFGTVVGQKRYPAPGDFWRMLLGTQYDETNSWALLGPISSDQAAYRDHGIQSDTTNYGIRIIGAIGQTEAQASFTEGMGYIELSPTPTDVRTLSFDYIGANYFFPLAWPLNTAVTSGALYSSQGNIYKITDSGTTHASNYPSDESGTSDTADYQLWRGRRTITGADTDYPIIDPDVIKLGVEAAWKRAKGMDFSVEAGQFDQAIQNQAGRFDGPKLISALSGDGIWSPNIPDNFVSTGWP